MRLRIEEPKSKEEMDRMREEWQREHKLDNAKNEKKEDKKKNIDKK